MASLAMRGRASRKTDPGYGNEYLRMLANDEGMQRAAARRVVVGAGGSDLLDMLGLET